MAAPAIYVCSNDDSEVLWSIENRYEHRFAYYDEDLRRVRGIYLTGTDYMVFEMRMYGDYIGLSTVPFATTPDIESGYEFPSGPVNVYVVPNVGGTRLDVTYNGAKIIDSLEVTPPVIVIYDGSIIATLNDGDTKTLQCNGKVMASNVFFDDANYLGPLYLLCVGELMASDVVVKVGGVTPTGETWVINESFDTSHSFQYYVDFTSNSERFSSISLTYFFNDVQLGYYPLGFVCTIVDGIIEWIDQSYRTITLDEPATGDFLTWLQANAVKQ